MIVFKVISKMKPPLQFNMRAGTDLFRRNTDDSNSSAGGRGKYLLIDSSQPGTHHL